MAKAKFDSIKAGDVLYDVHSYRMGNTTMRTQGLWTARVVSIHVDLERPNMSYALVSWNGNQAEKCFANGLSRYTTTKPRKLNRHMLNCRKAHDCFSRNPCTCAELEAAEKVEKERVRAEKKAAKKIKKVSP